MNMIRLLLLGALLTAGNFVWAEAAIQEPAQESTEGMLVEAWTKGSVKERFEESVEGEEPAEDIDRETFEAAGTFEEPLVLGSAEEVVVFSESAEEVAGIVETSIEAPADTSSKKTVEETIEEAAMRTVSVKAEVGIDYILQGSNDGVLWKMLAFATGPVAGVDGILEIPIPEGADYERYRLIEFADVGHVGEDNILDDAEMLERIFPDWVYKGEAAKWLSYLTSGTWFSEEEALGGTDVTQRVFPHWFYGFSHGNYFNGGIVGYHATNLLAPKFATSAGWVSTILNMLSIWAASAEGFHKDAPHVVEAHKDAYGHSEHWMAASTSSVVDVDWMSGYTDLSGWMAVFTLNALELASHSLGLGRVEGFSMWAGMIGDLIMSSYDFSNKAIRYSEVTVGTDPEGQVEYQRAWDGAWVYGLKLASAGLPFMAHYLLHKAGGADNYWSKSSSTVKWGGRLISTAGAVGYLYTGLGNVDHGHTEAKSE